MRASIVGILGAGVVAIAFALPVRGSGATTRESFRPKCGAHGWVLGVLDSSHIYDTDVDQAAKPDRNNPQITWPASRGTNYNGTVEADM